MWVSSLRLTDFRSYDFAEVELSSGVTAFVGSNGQGKTNLVEAIAYAAILGSHRVSSDAPLVRHGADRSILAVTVERADRSVLVEIEVNPGKANRARINRAAATRARDVLGLLTCVVFAPEDLALVKGDPSDRRRFLDDLMIQRTPRMQGVRSDYDRILKQRNTLLKSAQAARGSASEAMMSTLEVWNEQLAEAGASIIAARIDLLHAMRPALASWHAQIAGAEVTEARALSVEYASKVVDDCRDLTSIEHWRQVLLDAMTQRRREEIARGLTLVGPHRDDLQLNLGELPAKGYASHGESWSIALALKLASFDLLRQTGEEPVLILDDVFAELDTARRRRLADAVRECTQVLVTAAVPEDLPEELVGSRFTVVRDDVSMVRPTAADHD